MAEGDGVEGSGGCARAVGAVGAVAVKPLCAPRVATIARARGLWARCGVPEFGKAHEECALPVRSTDLATIGRNAVNLLKAVTIGLAFTLASTVAHAAEFKLVSSNAVKSSLEDLIPQFEK